MAIDGIEGANGREGSRSFGGATRDVCGHLIKDGGDLAQQICIALCGDSCCVQEVAVVEVVIVEVL